MCISVCCVNLTLPRVFLQQPISSELSRRMCSNGKLKRDNLTSKLLKTQPRAVQFGPHAGLGAAEELCTPRPRPGSAAAPSPWGEPAECPRRACAEHLPLCQAALCQHGARTQSRLRPVTVRLSACRLSLGKRLTSQSFTSPLTKQGNLFEFDFKSPNFFAL